MGEKDGHNTSGLQEGKNERLKRQRYPLNDRMHIKNKYHDNPPDFEKLALKYPTFAEHVTRNPDNSVTINFKDPVAVRELTYALLKQDYGITINIPANSLIPTVTSRVNYIHWLEDLLCLKYECRAQGPTIRGIDIGTGFSCIYSLLGSKLNQWSFIATDIDKEAVNQALSNVKQNCLEGVIDVRLTQPTDRLLLAVVDNDKCYDFCMCNPPFYSNQEDQLQTFERSHAPFSLQVNSAGKRGTMTEGGEVAFVLQIVEDSLVLRDRVTWYTSMVGKKSSLIPILAELKKQKVTNIRTTEFYQGRTARWGIAWSFSDLGVQDLPTLSKRGKVIGQAPEVKKKMIRLDKVSNVDNLQQAVQNILAQYLVAYTTTSQITRVLHIVATQHTWSRKARRELEKKQQEYRENTTTGPSRSDSLQTSPCLQDREVVDDKQPPLFEADLQIIGQDRTEGEEEGIGDDVLISLTYTGGDWNHLQAFGLHFARALAVKGYSLPGVGDVCKARSLDT